jgi:hypothetical protein
MEGPAARGYVVASTGEQQMADDSSLTISVPEAGKRYFGVCDKTAYALAKDGTIPTIQVGRLLRVPIRAMERKLDEAGAVA